MRWIIGFIIALSLSSANAGPLLTLTESGQYQAVGLIPEPVFISFGITGGLLTQERPQWASIDATINRESMLQLRLDQCANPPFCLKIYSAPQSGALLTDSNRILDIDIRTWGDPNDLALSYFFTPPYDMTLTLVRVGSVPEPATWAMMLLGLSWWGAVNGIEGLHCYDDSVGAVLRAGGNDITDVAGMMDDPEIDGLCEKIIEQRDRIWQLEKALEVLWIAFQDDENFRRVFAEVTTELQK